MSHYEQFKKTAKDTIYTIANASSALARRAKLTVDITRNHTKIRREHIEIGKKYYELFKEEPDDAFKDSCETITTALEQIAAMEKELEDLKNGRCCCNEEKTSEDEVS